MIGQLACHTHRWSHTQRQCGAHTQRHSGTFTRVKKASSLPSNADKLTQLSRVSSSRRPRSAALSGD